MQAATRAACLRRCGSAGFSLIELMVAAAIVAMPAAIAYPSYLSQMRKSRRSEASGKAGLPRCRVPSILDAGPLLATSV